MEKRKKPENIKPVVNNKGDYNQELRIVQGKGQVDKIEDATDVATKVKKE